MALSSAHSWQSLEDDIRQRIQSREWLPGELIPNETDLASEFGCARATVNRALRSLAEQGFLDRKRKAGTRVTLHPVRRATLHVPIIRKEIEERNQDYSYALITSKSLIPPTDVRARMKIDDKQKLLKVQALHLADGKPYVFEDRWVNVAAISGWHMLDLNEMSANEWLVVHIPLTTGTMTFSAINAKGETANILQVAEQTALFVVERTTWDNDVAITDAQMIYAEGYRMRTSV